MFHMGWNHQLVESLKSYRRSFQNLGWFIQPALPIELRLVIIQIDLHICIVSNVDLIFDHY